MLKNKIIVKKIRNIVILLMAIMIMLGVYFNIRNSKAENVIEISMEVIDRSGVLEMQTITVEATEASDGNYVLELPTSVNKNIISEYYTSEGEQIPIDAENNRITLQLTEAQIAVKKVQVQTEYDKKEVVKNDETQETKVLYNKELKNEDGDVIVTGYMPLDSELEVSAIDLGTLTSVKLPSDKQTMQKAYEMKIFEILPKQQTDEQVNEENTDTTAVENTETTENTAETPEQEITAENETPTEKVEYDPSVYQETITVGIKYQVVGEAVTIYNLADDNTITKMESTVKEEVTKITAEKAIAKYIIATEKVETQTDNTTGEKENWIDGIQDNIMTSQDESAMTVSETDDVPPEFAYEYSNTAISHGTKTVTVVFDITDKFFNTLDSSILTENNIVVTIDGVTLTNATKTLTKNADLKATVNGIANTKVGERYQLVMTGLDQGDGDNYSGIMTLTFPAGVATDNSGNSSLAKTITIGVDEPIVNIGNDTTLPYLPTGYNYVNGTSLANGLTIQDSKGNQYVWIEVPRTTEVYQTAGLSITEFTTDEYTAIEDDLHEYTKVYRNETSFTDTYDSDAATGLTITQYTELKQKMLRSVYQNGGFYVGKYETGIEDAPKTSGSSSTAPTETPVIKQNAYPYNYVTCSQAQTLASKFASGLDGHVSSLMFGVQWDLVLKYLETKGATQSELKTNSTSWGNYYDNLWNITNASSKYLSYNDATWTSGAYGEKTGAKSILLSTGASDTFSKQGIYDLAGNVREWTLERAFNKNGPCVYRSGDYNSYGDIATTSFRNGESKSYMLEGIGFRVALYKYSSSEPVKVDVVSPIWKTQNINIDNINKQVTVDLIATDKYLTGTSNSTLTDSKITVSVDGDTYANTAITKTLSAPTYSTNSETGLKEIKYTFTLSGWEEISKQSGKSFLEYSGTTKIKIAAGTITDDYTNTSNEKEFNLGQVDFIKPSFTYEYSNTTIDQGTKTVTIVFDVIDKYFNSSSFSTDTNASNITVTVGGVTATNAAKTLTKLQNLTATVNGITDTKIGERYQLVITGLDQGDGDNYSGIMTLEFPVGVVTDKSSNSNISKTITIGVDEPQIFELGNETTSPYLPTGYSYVYGTNLENGLTIRDSLGNQYVWVEVPRITEVYQTAGLTITEFTDDECTAIENDLYKYTSVYKSQHSSYYKDEYYSDDATGLTSTQYTELKQKMLKSVYQNGGFYVGKYETGIEDAPKTSGSSSTAPTETPVIKQNVYPYNFVTCSQAQTLASEFALGLDGYTSSLMFGVQWDLVLKYLETKGATQAELNSDSTSWGNYNNNLWNITNASSKYAVYNIPDFYYELGNWTIGAYGEKTATAKILLSTGASDTFSKQGIYDLAGNVQEWTLEHTTLGNGPCVKRGASVLSDRRKLSS